VVLLASGKPVPISQVKNGDKVLATNTKTGKTSAEAVTAVLVHHDTNLYDLTVKTKAGTEVIHTTSSHLFWDPSLKQWIPAKHLKKGEHLKTPDGSLAVADGGTTPKVHDSWMWDLTVPGNNDHDFYVLAGAHVDSYVSSYAGISASAILVHNIDCERATKNAGTIISNARNGIRRLLKAYQGKGGNYQGYHADAHSFTPERELEILSNPDAVYLSTGSRGNLIFQQGEDIVLTEGPGSRVGQIFTSYGPSGSLGDSGAAIYGGSPGDPGVPISKEMITEGWIPDTNGGWLPPAVQLFPKNLSEDG
jgi:hypothetical protein